MRPEPVLAETCFRVTEQYAGDSDGVKDTDGKAKAKDISHEAQTKAKDLTLKAKNKDTSRKAKTKDRQHKPKSLFHGDLSLWRDVMSESSCWHTRRDKNASLALLHLVRMGTN